MSPIIAIGIWTSTLFDKTLLLVAFLALLAPLWCLILAVVFLLIALLLRLVHAPRIMLCRAVDRDELEWL